MAATEDTSSMTVRNRRSDHTKDQTNEEQNGGVSDHINNLMDLKRHMDGAKAEIVEDVGNHLRILLDKAITEAVQSYRNRDKTDQTSVTKTRLQGPVTERRKIFLPRASLLDDLMEVEHFRSLYHMFVAAFCLFVIGTEAVDIIDKGRVVPEFSLLCYAFGKPGIVAWSWISMFTYTLLVPYKALIFWGSLYPKSNHKILLSAFVGMFLLVSQTCVLCIFPVYVVKHYQLPPASSFIVTLEQVRFLMKSYSLFREVIPTVLQNQKKEVQLPKLSSYLYFLFCPSLLYRDSYPRTPYIRWKYVFKNFAEFLGCLLFINYVLVNLCIPVFTNMSKQPFSTKTLVFSIFHSTLPGTALLLLSFFGFMHCWLNAFAEMLRFADRMFYKDWWNSTSFSGYFRTWNVVVHDWLYYYVYQDLLWLLNQKFRTGLMLAVFVTSASAHEYAITLSLGYFYPVMFCLFAGIGVVFYFAINDKQKSPVYNVMVWIFLFIGQGIQVCLYCQEWYAQIHCPLTEKTFWGLVTPRSWSCYL